MNALKKRLINSGAIVVNNAEDPYNKKHIKINNSHLIIENLTGSGKSLKFTNLYNKTKGPAIIVIPVLAARNAGYKTIMYNIMHKPINYNAPMENIIEQIGFVKANPYAPHKINLTSTPRKNLRNINVKKYVNTPISRFNKSLMARKNIIVERPRKDKRVLRTLNKKAYLQLTLKNNNSIEYSLGETNVNARGKGLGTFLRTLPINLARRAGIKRITHKSVFLDRNQEKAYKSKGRNVPPSRYITERLGFKPINNLHSVLNLQ